MDEEICTCGHRIEEHADNSGKCTAAGCPCEAYMEDMDDPAMEDEEEE